MFSFRNRSPRETASIAGKSSVPSTHLPDVTPRAQVKSLLYHLGRALLTQENDSCLIGNFADLAAGFNAIDPRQANIEKNHIGLYSFGLLDCLQPLSHLAD